MSNSSDCKPRREDIKVVRVHPDDHARFVQLCAEYGLAHWAMFRRLMESGESGARKRLDGSK